MSSELCPLGAVDFLWYVEKSHKEPKTPRKGRDLEILVANLEKHLGDTGIQVTSPDYIVGRRSGSRREVDVALRAKLGSSNILIIVECRDRDETEDVTWIEQLAGKREEVGADKAVAVSAVGFTEGAKNAAATYGIPLLTLQQVDLSEALLWFPFQEIQLDKLCWTLHHIEIAVDQDALGSLSSVANQSENPETLRAGDVPFRAKRDGSLALIWQHLWNDLPGPRLYEEVPSDGTRIPYVVQLQFPNEQLRYQVQTAMGFIDVMEITLFADLWIERELVPLAVVRSYDDEGHVLARDAQFHVEHEYAKLAVSFSQYPDKETQSIAVWGAGKPNVSTFVEVDVSPPQSRAGTKVVRLTARGS